VPKPNRRKDKGKRPAPPARGRAPRAPGNGRWLLLAAVVPLLLYLPILGHGFLLDDFVLFKTSPSLSELGSIGRGFTHDLGAVRKGGEEVDSSYYRPVFVALSTLYYQVAEGSPRAWHFASVALAALVSALFCAWLVRLGLPPPGAALAAIVFSLHPAHVSSVAWASGLQELLAALFVALALLAACGRLEPRFDGVSDRGPHRGYSLWR